MFLYNRSFVNIALVITGIFTLATGVFLFFHIKSHLIVHVHEIASLFFVMACLLHAIMNWKPLLHSMKGRLPSWAVVVLLAVTVLGMAYSVIKG